MMALEWGFSIDETAGKLMEVSAKAKENGERYALRTAQNAAAAVERNTARETRSSSARLSRGDVLYGKMRPYLKKVWVAEFD